MRYQIEFKPRAVKDLRRLPKKEAGKILDSLERLTNNLTGNVKKLTNYSPEYRLRIGNYRALFEVEDEERIVVYRILHRKDAYR